VGIGEMCSASAEEISQDFEALESLVVDNPDLERLEALLDEFNIFEATKYETFPNYSCIRQVIRIDVFLL
jgi:hypothetical protein